MIHKSCLHINEGHPFFFLLRRAIKIHFSYFSIKTYIVGLVVGNQKNRQEISN